MLDRETALHLLQEKKVLLEQQGIFRLPQRNDFTDAEVAAIKAFCGPWPRALEAAGLKPPRTDDRLTRNREKRIRARRKRNEARENSDKTKV